MPAYHVAVEIASAAHVSNICKIRTTRRAHRAFGQIIKYQDASRGMNVLGAMRRAFVTRRIIGAISVRARAAAVAMIGIA